jgi:hypothetical protein
MEWASFNGPPAVLIKGIIEVGITVKYLATLNPSVQDAPLFPQKRRLKLLLTAFCFYGDNWV